MNFRKGNTVRFVDHDGAGDFRTKQHKLYTVTHDYNGTYLVKLDGDIHISDSRVKLVSETTLPFTTGDKVVIKDKSSHYDYYKVAAADMGLTNFKQGQRMNPAIQNGEVVTVLSARAHCTAPNVVVVGVERENGEQHIFGASALELVVTPPYPVFNEGDKVRVKPSVERPLHGWGAVKAGDVGVVSTGNNGGKKSSFQVNFPAQYSWNAASQEMELYTLTPLEVAQEEIERLKKVLDKKDAELVEVRTKIAQATDLLSEI